MIINDDDLELIVEQVLDDERKRIYDSWIYDGSVVPPICHIKRPWYRRKSVVLMEQEAWENYQSEVKEILQALCYAHKQLECFKQAQYQETKVPFDDYIKKEVLDYDTENFEKMRDRFEEVCKIDDGIEL